MSHSISTTVRQITISFIIMFIVVSCNPFGRSVDDNKEYFGGMQWKVDLDRAIAQTAVFDAVRVGTPAKAIDTSYALQRGQNLHDQASLIIAEVNLMKSHNSDSDTDDPEAALKKVYERYQALLDNFASDLEQANQVIDLYKVVVALPNYNKDQKQALNKCAKALEKGDWGEASKQCEIAQKVAVPSIPKSTKDAAALPVTPVLLTPIP